MNRRSESLSALLLLIASLSLTAACRHAGVPIAPIPTANLTASAATPLAAAAVVANAAPRDTPSPAPLPPSNSADASSNRARDRAVARTLASINELLDAYFDYNAFQLRPDAIQSVTAAAGVLREHMQSDPSIRLVVEGHCDERGSAEFNLALGDRRAESVRDMLAQLGLAPDRMTTISYGENKPACGEASENCWQRNRRAHIRHER